MAAPFSLLRLDQRDRSGFACDSAALNRYFQTQVSQDIRRRLTACIIAVHPASDSIAGFYTLSAADIPLTDLPPEMTPPAFTRPLPRYPTLPAARLGRLAVDTRFIGQKLGATLLADAVLRAATSAVAVFAMIVDAKDATAEAFYRHHGFTSYGSAPGKLLAPLNALLPGR